VVDAIGAENPHRSLQHPQLEAEDEVVADEKAVAEGKGPLAPREDGTTAGAEDDVHQPDKLWPALLHQRNLTDGEARGREDPPDCLGQAEGGEAPGMDVDEELQ
jgi:hypothetical protein